MMETLLVHRRLLLLLLLLLLLCQPDKTRQAGLAESAHLIGKSCSLVSHRTPRCLAISLDHTLQVRHGSMTRAAVLGI